MIPKMHTARNVAVLVCLASVFAVCTIAQSTKTPRIDECISKQSCRECIRTPECVWCSEKRAIKENDGRPRCQNQEKIANTKSANPWCPSDMIVNPVHDVKIIEALDFSSAEDAQIQITPQRVKMRLRRGQAETLTIKYKQAEDYPVDLYFLMDLSATMEKHKDNLSKLGISLKDAITTLTSNFHLGFGSFVDKVILPMTNTQPEWMKTCKLMDNVRSCAPPYGFKNTLNLTNKYEDFEKHVQSAPISGNLDAAEGGLDALMQVMVCRDIIGWRNNSRHLLVYSSDAPYHIAGDGRLAGLIERNDESCHLNETGYYTYAETLDYPSISQINKQAKKNDVNIIFAVTEDQQEVYKNLSSRIRGSSTGLLDNKSDKVVAIVRDEYKKLTNEITMISNADESLEVKYRTRCLDKSGELREQNYCNGVRVDTILEFEVSIKVNECPERREDRHKTIEIKPQDINERVTVEIDIICDCDCSQPNHENYEVDSKLCSTSGNLTCGICECKENFFGKECNCQGNDEFQQNAEHQKPCRKDGKVCSDRGRCVCGMCMCESRPNKEEAFFGQHCEYDNFSCKRYEGQVCGGPKRGECNSGKCNCKPGWDHDDCHCKVSNEACIPPGENKTECSGQGQCICGSCSVCKEGRHGEWCELCPTCPSQRCDVLKACVECHAYKSGPEYEKGKLCPDCGNIEVDLVDDIDEDPKATHEKGTHVCAVPDSSGCTFVFTYMEPDSENPGRGDVPITSVTAEKSKHCPEPLVSAFGVAGGAIGITLFLGLVGLLIWKLLTMFHDKREWVKFEKERGAAKWDRGENPLFKEPTSTFKNPTFEDAK